MLVVLCSSAFAAMNLGQATRNRTEEDNGGTNIAVAMPYRRTRTYRVSTVNPYTDTQHGIRPIKIPRVRSVPIRIAFLGNRSTVTPMSGPRSIGGSVWRKPMILVFRGDPVTEYTNQSSAKRLTPSATCEST